MAPPDLARTSRRVMKASLCRMWRRITDALVEFEKEKREKEDVWVVCEKGEEIKDRTPKTLANNGTLKMFVFGKKNSRR